MSGGNTIEDPANLAAVERIYGVGVRSELTKLAADYDQLVPKDQLNCLGRAIHNFNAAIDSAACHEFVIETDPKHRWYTKRS